MATHPENSIAGFLHAMSCGADGVELDVFALDDVLLVTHDPVLRRDGLPTLDEVLALDAPEGFWFDIEAKSAPARLVSEAIRRASAQHRVLVRSFDHSILRAFHALEPDVPMAALIEYASDDWAGIARAASASIISPHVSSVTGARVTAAHEAGIAVSAWTVNRPADWDRMAGLGVDAIITDDPGAAMAHFGGG